MVVLDRVMALEMAEILLQCRKQRPVSVDAARARDAARKARDAAAFVHFDRSFGDTLP